MVVQHNLTAINTNRQFGIVDRSLSSSAKKLSSGYRINVAADDAAGLSISEKMRKQIRGLNQASLNAEDGISMIQTAEGALGEVHDMLQRLNELSVKSANGTNSDSDRQALQDEVDQLKTEIDRVAETTKFNELYLLKGREGKSAAVPMGASPLITVTSVDELKQYSGTKIYYTDDVITAQTSGPANTIPAGMDSTKYNKLVNTLKTEIVPQSVMSFINNMDAFDYLDGSSIGIGLDITNDPSNTTLASVTISASGIPNNPSVGYQLMVNAGRLTFDGNGNLTESSRNDLEVTIIHEMMHAFMDESLTNGMLGIKDGTVDASNKFPGWFAEGMAQAVAGGMYNGNDWVNGSLGLNENSSLAQIKSALTNATNKLGSNTNASKYGTGYLASMYLAYKAGTGGTLSARLTDGLDQVLASLMNGQSLENVIKEKTGYNTIANFENNFGTTDEQASFVSNLLKTVGTNGSGGILTGFSNVGGVLNNAPLAGVKLFNLDKDHTFVYNSYPDGYNVFSGGGKGAAGKGLGIRLDGSLGWSAALNQISLHIGSEADLTNKLFVHIDAMNCDSIGITDLEVMSEDSATLSIKTVAKAIAKVSTQRSLLGAYQNRLEHTIKNLDNIVENTTASESKIRDTDMAKEMVNYSNNQILSQAGQAMLSQAKQSNQGVLSLLA